AWRSTNVAALARTPFEDRLHEEAAGAGVTPGALERSLLGPWDAARVVFVDGRHAPGLSRGTAGAAGITIEPLAEAIRRGAPDVRDHLTRLADARSNPFTALNTALFEDGAVVRVPRGAAPSDPLHIVFVSTGTRAASGAPRVSYPRCLILAEAGSQ